MRKSKLFGQSGLVGVIAITNYLAMGKASAQWVLYGATRSRRPHRAPSIGTIE